MASTLIARGAAAPHSQSAYSKLTPPAATGLTLRQRLASTRGKSVPVANPRPRGSTVGATVKYPQTAATHIPAAAIQPAAAYNKVEQSLDNDITTVPVSKPWTPEYAASLLTTRGKEAKKALAEPSIEDVAEEVAFALKRAVSDDDKDRLEEQLETLRALAAVKKRRGELSPEQQQIVRGIALDVERHHETAAAAAEAFLRAKRDVEAENLAEGQSLLEADLEAKRELAAALAAEAKAAGIEAEAMAAAKSAKRELKRIKEEMADVEAKGEKLSEVKDAILDEMKSLSKRPPTGGVQAFIRRKRQIDRSLKKVDDDLAKAVRTYKELHNRSAKLPDEIDAAKEIAKEAGGVALDTLLKIEGIHKPGVEQAAEELASFVPRAPPVRRPQTRSRTRLHQKTAEMSRALSQTAAPSAGPEFELSPAFDDLLEQAAAALAQTPSRPSRKPAESKYDITGPSRAGPDPAQMTSTQKKDHIISMLRSEISDFNPKPNWNRSQTWNVLQKSGRMDLLEPLRPYL